MSTVSISLVRDITIQVRPPRALFVRWPFGHPLGEPFAKAQQQRILHDMLRALDTMSEPGSLVDLGYRWRRERYDEPE